MGGSGITWTRDDHGIGIANGNGNPMGMVTKLGMGMGRNGNWLHENGRGLECKKPFPVISNLNHIGLQIICTSLQTTSPVPLHSSFSQDRCPSSYLTNSITLRIIYKRSHNNCEKCEQCLYMTQKVISRFLVHKITVCILPTCPHLQSTNFGPLFTCWRSAGPHLHVALHFLCNHFVQLVHCIELLPTPLPQTPHGHLTAFCITFCRSPLIITLLLFIFTLMPLFSTKLFCLLSLLIRSSSVSANTTRSSAYNNSNGKATLNSLDKASMTVTNSKGLNAEPWCILTLPENHCCFHKLFVQLLLHQYT